MSETDQLVLSSYHQEWLQYNNASATLDNGALQDLATQLRTPIDAEPCVFLPSVGPLPKGDASNVVVDWPVPSETFTEPEHQLQLTKAVGVALLTIKQEAQRRATNLWGGFTLLAGAVIAGIGERVFENDVMHVGGIIVAGVGGMAIALANTRSAPKAPSIDGLKPAPIRLEREVK